MPPGAGFGWCCYTRCKATELFWGAGIQEFEVALRRWGTFPAEEIPAREHMARMLSADLETTSLPTSRTPVEVGRDLRVFGTSSRCPAIADSAEDLAAG